MNSIDFLFKSIIAHRGIHYKYLENTILAFEEAIKKKYIVEFDVRLTKDKQVVVFHDANLKRIFEIDRDINDLTLEELRQYQYISTFSEILEMIDGRVPIIIDVKFCRGIESKIASELDNYKGLFAIQSFSPLTILWFKINRPNYIRGYLIYQFLYLKSILFILKPSYIATNLGNLWSLNKYRYKYKVIGYTIKNKKEYQIYKNQADNFIFDIWNE